MANTTTVRKAHATKDTSVPCAQRRRSRNMIKDVLVQSLTVQRQLKTCRVNILESNPSNPKPPRPSRKYRRRASVASQSRETQQQPMTFQALPPLSSCPSHLPTFPLVVSCIAAAPVPLMSARPVDPISDSHDELVDWIMSTDEDFSDTESLNSDTSSVSEDVEMFDGEYENAIEDICLRMQWRCTIS